MAFFVWTYLATARQRDEAKRNRAEPGEVEQKEYCATAQTVSELVRELSSAKYEPPVSIKSPCNLYIFGYNKLINGNRHRVVGQNLRKNLPSTANVTGKVFALCSFTYKT